MNSASCGACNIQIMRIHQTKPGLVVNVIDTKCQLTATHDVTVYLPTTSLDKSIHVPVHWHMDFSTMPGLRARFAPLLCHYSWLGN